MWDDFKSDKEFEPKHLCNAWVATAIIGSAVVGGAVSAYSSSKAADAQIQAANTAAGTEQRGQDIALQQYQTTRSDLQPFRDIGANAGNQLTDNLANLTSPIQAPTLPTLPDQTLPTLPTTMDQATLEKTPGYQFNLTQGLKAVQNSAAARGLGSSGAALKGAATFATGLADNTYQNQFNNQQQLFGNQQQIFGNQQQLFSNRQQQFGNQQQIFTDAQQNQANAFNRLQSLVTTGENAAAQTGSAATAAGSQAVTAAGQIGGTQVGAGNAAAAGINATGAALTNSTNNIGGYLAYKGLYGNNNNNSSIPSVNITDGGSA